MNERLNDIETSMYLLQSSIDADLFEFNTICQKVTKFSFLPTVEQIYDIAERYMPKISEWKALYKEKEKLTREPINCREDDRYEP
jgi:hypothetical protein